MELISRQAAIKDAESWVAVDEYEKHLQKNVVEWLKEFPPAELGTNLAEVGTDCISREQAIDVATSATMEWDGMYVQDLNVRIREAIEKLPPIQPDNNSENPNSSDAISRQAAIDYFVLNVGFHDEDGYPIEDTDELRKIWTEYFSGIPTAELKIIRCKDCKHWIPYDWMFSEVWQSQNIDDYPEDEIGCKYCDMSMKANDYCSRAERKEVTE